MPRIVRTEVPDPPALREFSCRSTGGCKAPRRFRFVDALPKSVMGKTLKAELRQCYRND